MTIEPSKIRTRRRKWGPLCRLLQRWVANRSWNQPLRSQAFPRNNVLSSGLVQQACFSLSPSMYVMYCTVRYRTGPDSMYGCMDALHGCMYVCMCMCMCVCVFCTYVCVYIYMCIYRACTYVCIYIICLYVYRQYHLTHPQDSLPSHGILPAPPLAAERFLLSDNGKAGAHAFPLHLPCLVFKSPFWWFCMVLS